MNWWIIAVIIMILVIAAEAVFILPDKMPWNKRRKKK